MDDLTLDDKTVVEAARNAYSTLTGAQQALVTNLEKLEAAEAKIAELEADQAATEEANEFKATHAIALSLTEGTVSIGDKSAVETALDAYEELSPAVQVKLVAEKALLDSLLAKIGQLEQEKADRAAAQSVIAQIDELPAADELTLENKDAVEAARNAYSTLTEAQQALVTNLEKLEAAEAKIAELEADQAATEEANEFKATHAIALSLTEGTVSIGDKSAVETALDAYEELSPAVQVKLVAEKALLDSLLAKIGQLEQEKADRAAAQSVIAQIDELPEIDDITLDNLEQVKEAAGSARNAYEGLTEDQQILIPEETLLRLVATEEKITELEEDQAASGQVTELIENLPSLEQLTLDDKDSVVAARNAYNALTPAQQRLVTNFRKLEATEARMAELQITVNHIGDETLGDLYIVNREYTDNSIKSDAIGPVTLKIGDKDVTENFDFTFYDVEGGKKITSFNLSNGGSTFKAYMVATSEEYNDVSANVIFKYGSVTIGNNDTYYTIEDALAQAGSGVVYVNYNTSFAGPEVAQVAYGTTRHTIKNGVTVLLPYSEALSQKTDDTPSGTGVAVARTNAYVDLNIPGGVELQVNGVLTVNAMRASISTKYCGHVTGSNYAQLHLAKGSKITVENGGTLHSIGFIYGEGRVEAMSGSTIYEPMFIKSFRGGTATSRVGLNVFPFDQYTINNIEVALTINSGARHIASALIYMNSKYYKGDLDLIGADEHHLIRLTDGQLIKSYDIETGQLKFDFHGDASINIGKINVSGITADSDGKDMPFDGTWRFNVAPGSNVVIDSWVALLPGAEMSIEPGANITITEDGRLTVFDPYEHLDDYNDYPNRAENYYRIAPAFGYDADTPAKLVVDGTLTLEGGLAGRVHVGDNGLIVQRESAFTAYDFKYVTGTQFSASFNSREVSLWEADDTTINVVADKDSLKQGNKEDIAIRAIVKDKDNNPLPDIKVEFTGGKGQWDKKESITDQNGKVEAIYTTSGEEEIGTLALEATVPAEGISARANIEISESDGGCPLIYSYDGQRFHLEHEPVPTSANKAFEGTTFGTLRKLHEIDGQYHIRVGEDDLSETYVNGVNLYAVEYEAGNDVKEVFVDINGKPHTIRDRIAPKSFVDSGGKNWIGELTTDGKFVSAPGLSMLEQGQYVETYVATFDLPKDATDMGKLMIRTQETNLTVDFVGWYHNQIDGCNNVWWLERALQTNDGIWGIIDAIGMLGLDVELWNGTEWVYQGTVANGSHFFEEFLIPIDLSLLGDEVNEVKVRFKSGSGFVMFDQVSMDFSPDQPMTVYPLDLQQALYNGNDDVTSVVSNIDEQRVKLQKGDYLDLFFLAPDLADSYERGLFVDFTGYYHWGLESKTHPIVNTWDEFTYEEIIESVLEVQPEAAETVEVLEWLFDLTETTLGKSMEYKIENIYVGHALPWMKENLWQRND